MNIRYVPKKIIVKDTIIFFLMYSHNLSHIAMQIYCYNITNKKKTEKIKNVYLTFIYMSIYGVLIENFGILYGSRI